MILAQVILDIPTVSLDTPYTYAIPPECEADAAIGCAVDAPFGGRKAVGFIIALFTPDQASELGIQLPDAGKIRPISAVLSCPYFDEVGAACAQFLAKRYLAPLSTCIRLFTPPGGVPKASRVGRNWIIEQPTIKPVDETWVVRGPAFDSFSPKKNAVKQRAVWEAVAQADVKASELAAEYGSVTQVLKTLEKAGVVREEHRRRLRGVQDAACFTPSAKPSLTDGQKQAVAVIVGAIDAAKGDVIVVDGVTGSGKTEVYLQAIEHALQQGKTACVLVPEISLTPQTVGRFRARFGNMVAVLHSRMSLGERYDQWEFIQSGTARVVVGARSALFSPLKNVGIIVIDEEHEGSYKQDSAPRYVSRDVARWLCCRHGAALVLGSATPSIEALQRCEAGGNVKTSGSCEGCGSVGGNNGVGVSSNIDAGSGADIDSGTWHHVLLPERANGKKMPSITVVNMAREFQAGHKSMFSRPLIAALEAELALGHKAVLLLNQRGFAKFVLCRDCGFVPTCPSCSTSLTYHERGELLICHHCGYQMSNPAQCPECGSPYLRKFGAGTQRVEDDLHTLIAGMDEPACQAKVIRMDADTTKAKGSHQRLLEEFGSAEGAVLLGTQMIAKGLDFSDVTVVGVINADTTLKLPDFRAGERTFNLVEQVAGRAGRADLVGHVYVQTYCADAVAIQAAATYNRELFLQDELPKRRLLGYPPFVRMANVLIWGTDESQVRMEAQLIHGALCKEAADSRWSSVTVMEATPCALAKLRNTYRWHIIIKAPLGTDISAFCEPTMRGRKASSSVRAAVDIDPEDLF